MIHNYYLLNKLELDARQIYLLRSNVRSDVKPTTMELHCLVDRGF
jgi:hypothetical protein